MSEYRRIVYIRFSDGEHLEIEYTEDMDVGMLFQQISDKREINILKLGFKKGHEEVVDYDVLVDITLEYTIHIYDSIRDTIGDKYYSYIIRRDYRRYIENPKKYILTIVNFNLDTIEYDIIGCQDVGIETSLDKKRKYDELIAMFKQKYEEKDIDYLLKNIYKYETLVEEFIYNQSSMSYIETTHIAKYIANMDDKLDLYTFVHNLDNINSTKKGYH